MTDNVLHLVQDVGDGVHLEADQILEQNKGEFQSIAMVGRRPDGSMAVAGTDSAAESVLLLAWAQSFLVNNHCLRA